MKVGFIGLGRMGQVMARRLIEGGHDVGAYNRTAAKAEALVALGARPMNSMKEAANYGVGVFTMLADDPAVVEVVTAEGGLLASLPKGGTHICSGTHSVATIQKLKTLHDEAGQVLIATPMLGRPDVVASGQAGMVLSGVKDSVDGCLCALFAVRPRNAHCADDLTIND